MNYFLIKQLHIGLALISISGFVLRWVWQIRGSALRNHRITRIAPHIVDTLLLLAGVFLAIASSQYPWSQAWLGAKIVGLVIYIVLGMAAMSMGTRLGQTATFVLAIFTFLWIISVAQTKLPLGFFQVLL